MAKFKKIDDWYLAQDFSIGVSEGVNLKLVSGTQVIWIKTNKKRDGQTAISHVFQVRNTPFMIEVEDKFATDLVVGFGEEAQRASTDVQRA